MRCLQLATLGFRTGLITKTLPANSNKNIYQDINDNVLVTNKLLDACVKANIKKFIFLSSGGTVYGNVAKYPICEDEHEQPITSYGFTKVTIEKLLYLYKHVFSLDYKTIRLANAFGPFQNPLKGLGAVTTFIYKALNHEPVTLFGDGSIIRDYLYIDNVINALCNVAFLNSKFSVYNVGSGKGISLKEVLEIIEKVTNEKIQINYLPSRNVDVPVNYLNVSRYESEFGKIQKVSMDEGIIKTINYLKGEI